MKKIISLPILATAGICTLTSAQPTGCDSNRQRPNIILFLVDDMGWQDTSVPFWNRETLFNQLYETPNMERLAQQGMKFTQAYACTVSSPSRCSLLSGMNAARHRVTNWTLERDTPTDKDDSVIEIPAWHVNGMAQVPGVPAATQITSFVQILKDKGYHTIHCGKAHFGAVDTPGADPRHFGFDVNIAGHAAGGLASYLGKDNFGNDAEDHPLAYNAVPDLEAYHGKDIFITEALTREALRALENNRASGKPFFLNMAHHAVHIPIQADHRFYQKYLDKGMDTTEAAYASMIEGMDKSLGDIMDWLEVKDLAENTIILFMSDNGGLSITNRGGVPNTHNVPLNSGKGSAYEGGIREPMIVSWPGVVAPNTQTQEFVIIEDFFPTILEMAGIRRYKTVQTVDGISFVPILKGEKQKHAESRCLYWNFPNLWRAPFGPGIDATCSIREGDWKLIYYYRSGKKELFNIRENIGETDNCALAQPERVASLSAKLGRYLRSVNAQRPTFIATGLPVPWPDE